MSTKNGISGVSEPWARSTFCTADLSWSWQLFIWTLLTANEVPSMAAYRSTCLWSCWCISLVSYLINKTDRTWSSTLNQNQVLPLSGEWCWSSARATRPVLGRSCNELLCEIQGETEGHTAPHSTLTSDHAIETLGEREAGIYTPPRSTLGKSRRTQPWARVSLHPNILHHFLSPCCNPTRIWLPMQPIMTPKELFNSYYPSFFLMCIYLIN